MATATDGVSAQPLLGARTALQDAAAGGIHAHGGAPTVRAFAPGAAESDPFPDAHTAAFCSTVPKAPGDLLVPDAARPTSGTATSANVGELLAEQNAQARADGALICPEGAASLAAARQPREAGWPADNDSVVTLSTGAGLRYAEMVGVRVPALGIDSATPAESAT